MSLVPGAGRKIALDQACREFTDHLLSERSDVLDYLTSRGMSSTLVQKYRLGVVPDDCSTEWKPYVGRLAIPYQTRSGIVTVRFRQATEKGTGPKYLSLPGDKPRLFNVPALFDPKMDTLAIVEGEIDAVTVHEYAGVPAIGVQGVANWSPVFARMVEDFGSLLIVGDGDEAGKNFAQGLAEALEATPVIMPEGHDCNSFFVQHGALELRDVFGV